MDIIEIEEVDERGTMAPPMVIAVAVKKGGNSTFAVKWALNQFMSPGQTLILLHVRPRLLTIPTPMGNRVPISQVQEDAVAAYMQEVDSQTNAMFSPYQRLCNAKKVKTVLAVAEEADVAAAIIQQISSYCIGKLVIGSSSRNAITRRFKGLDVPATVAKNAPDFCTVYAISKGKILSVRSASSKEFKIGNPEHFSDIHSDFSDMSDSSSLRTGGTKSESEASIQCFSQPVPFQRNHFFPNDNPVMRSSIVSNLASTISNISSHRSGTISMRSQTSSIPEGYGDYESGDGRSSMSRSECYSEYSSTMSIEEIDNFYTSKSRFSLDTGSVDGLNPTLLEESAIFSDSVNFHNENRKPEMEISSWDFKTASTSNNEPLPQGQAPILLASVSETSKQECGFDNENTNALALKEDGYLETIESVAWNPVQPTTPPLPGSPSTSAQWQDCTVQNEVDVMQMWENQNPPREASRINMAQMNQSPLRETNGTYMTQM